MSLAGPARELRSTGLAVARLPPQPGEDAGNAQKGLTGALMLAVRAGHGDGGLPGMRGLPADGLE